MKKAVSIIIALLMPVILFCSCGGTRDEAGGISIVCTTFPQYDFARNILGSSDGLTLLLDDGADLLSLGVNHLKGF